jgi:hypothetical protein
VEKLGDALMKLEQWVQAEQETSAFEIRPRQQSRLELELAEYQPPSRGRWLAGVLGVLALMIAALGYFMYERARGANEAAAAAMERAAAAIVAQNAPGRKTTGTSPVGSASPDAAAGKVVPAGSAGD